METKKEGVCRYPIPSVFHATQYGNEWRVGTAERIYTYAHKERTAKRLVDAMNYAYHQSLIDRK